MRGPLRSPEPLGPSDPEVCAGPVRRALKAQRRTRPRGLPASIPLMTRMDRTPSPTRAGRPPSPITHPGAGFCWTPVKGHPAPHWASHVRLAVKNPPANAGEMRDAGLIPDPLEKGMATHSSLLSLENPMDGGAW